MKSKLKQPKPRRIGPITASLYAWATAFKVHSGQMQVILRKAGVEYDAGKDLTAEQIFEAVTFRSEKDQAAARKSNADAEAQEMENKKTRNELMELAQIEKVVWNDCMAPLRQELEQMPRSLCGMCNPEDPAVAQKVLVEWVEKTKTNIREKK